MDIETDEIMNKLDLIEETILQIKKLLNPGKEQVKKKPNESVETTEEQENGTKRISCPNCNSLNFTKHEDKSKVIYYHQGAPIYGKKGVCNQCGTEFSLN